jgi:GNAT superfamily N-acetyltransferase
MPLDLGGGYVLRHATSDDHAALSYVCLKTGDSGRDASEKEDDPDLLGTIYAVPYQVFEPNHAYVFDGPSGVEGYVLGALDSERFYARLVDDWFKPLRKTLPDPGPDRKLWKGSAWARYLIHHQEYTMAPAFASYPSHLHIDLMPAIQGRGFGRIGIEHLMHSLAAAGSPGVHLGVGANNTNARAFYARVGFEPLTGEGIPEKAVYLCRRLP